MIDINTRCYECETIIEGGKVKDKRKKPIAFSRHIAWSGENRSYYLCSIKCKNRLKKRIYDISGEK